MSEWTNDIKSFIDKGQAAMLTYNNKTGEETILRVCDLDNITEIMGMFTEINNYNNSINITESADIQYILKIPTHDVGRTFCKIVGRIDATNTSQTLTAYTRNLPVTYYSRPGVNLINSIVGNRMDNSPAGVTGISSTTVGATFATNSTARYVTYEVVGYLDDAHLYE